MDNWDPVVTEGFALGRSAILLDHASLALALPQARQAYERAFPVNLQGTIVLEVAE
jgi:hypothetical protein